MDNNDLLLLLVILFLMYKMCNTCNTKESFAQDNCDCQDKWSFYAPKSYDGKSNLGQKTELKFNGCDNLIKGANPSEEQWCYTKGSCPVDNDPMSDTYQPFEGGKHEKGVKFNRVTDNNDPTNKVDQFPGWRRCSQTKFQDEPKVKAVQMKKMIDAKFNAFSEKIGAQQCIGKEKETCLNNFNKCVPKCFTKDTMQRGALLKELEPKMKCLEIIEKISALAKDETSSMEDLEEARKIGESVCSTKVFKSKNEKEVRENLNSEVIEIAKKYQDVRSTECLGEQALFVKGNKDEGCCKVTNNCAMFLENELGLSPNAKPAGKIDDFCIRDDYNKLDMCSEN